LYCNIIFLKIKPRPAGSNKNAALGGSLFEKIKKSSLISIKVFGITVYEDSGG